MFLIPLSQIESVELVVHALRVAGGQADCSACPARRVCMKQCLSIAESIERMLHDGNLQDLQPDGGSELPTAASTGQKKKGGLTLIK